MFRLLIGYKLVITFQEIKKINAFYLTLNWHNFACEVTLILLCLSNVRYLQFWHSDALVFCGLQNLYKRNVCIVKCTLSVFLRCLKLSNFLCLWVVLTARNRQRWLGRSQSKRLGWTTEFFHLPDSSLTPFHQRKWLHQKRGTSFSPISFVKAWQIICRLLCIRKLWNTTHSPNVFGTRDLWTGWILNYISYNLPDDSSYFLLEKSFCFLSFCKDVLISSIVTLCISVLQWGIDTSLEWPTSLCRRT